jgi:hypothetical protein
MFSAVLVQGVSLLWLSCCQESWVNFPRVMWIFPALFHRWISQRSSRWARDWQNLGRAVAHNFTDFFHQTYLVKTGSYCCTIGWIFLARFSTLATHTSRIIQYVLYRARPFVVTTTHEPLKAHPNAACCHHRCCHRHRLKRPVVIIARDTAAEEAVGPRINGACSVKEVKGGTAQSFQQQK